MSLVHTENLCCDVMPHGPLTSFGPYGMTSQQIFCVWTALSVNKSILLTEFTLGFLTSYHFLHRLRIDMMSIFASSMCKLFHVSSIIDSVYITLYFCCIIPTLVQNHTKKVTPSDQFTLGRCFVLT